MPLYVAPGKSITTRRGVVAEDNDRPEITAKCLGAREGDPDSLERAQASVAYLLGRGVLIEADESPWHAIEGVTAADSAPVVKTPAPPPAPETPAPPVQRGDEATSAPDPLGDAAAAAKNGSKKKGSSKRKGGARRGG